MLGYKQPMLVVSIGEEECDPNVTDVRR
jgi:hypothetical protein